MEGWAAELESGKPDAAWDLFLDRYRRLIFAAIRHYAQDYDDVMDVFARVCEALCEGDLRRLRVGAEPPQIAFAQGLTHPREHVHHIIVVLGVMADGRADETSLAVEKQVPYGVGVAR